MLKKTAAGQSTLDMTRGSIFPLVVSFAVPLLIGNIFQQMYNMVDSMVAGNYLGPQALAAVGLGGMPHQVMIALFLGVGTGASILVSQFRGSGDEEGIRRLVKTAANFVLLAGVPLTVLGVLLTRPFLFLMNVPEDTYGMSYTYLLILFLSILPNLGYNFNSGILRGLGDSRSPMLFLIVSTVVNIALDLLFVAGLGMGVEGVAIATGLAQLVAWVFSVVFIRRRYPALQFAFASRVFDRALCKRFFFLGLPSSSSNAFYAFGHVLLFSMVNGHGSIFAAGFSAAAKLDALVYMPAISFATAATTFAGQNVGARQYGRLKSGIRTISLAAHGVNIVLVALLVAFGRQLLWLFTDNGQVVQDGYMFLLIVEPFNFVFLVFFLLNAYMNGAGETRVTTVANLVMFGIFRLPTAWLLSTMWGKYALLWCYPISWVAGVAIIVPYYLSGRWKRHFIEPST